ncbi:hypothetical protein [Pedobacter aquatilis]|uniref:hypothetical protein n=1 Tax=Pedobacter aquatilis TaxID=351343 RepID=UPI0029318C9F|nr:hypothetical protein [Pedobacter aquatilis]
MISLHIPEIKRNIEIVQKSLEKNISRRESQISWAKTSLILFGLIGTTYFLYCIITVVFLDKDPWLQKWIFFIIGFITFVASLTEKRNTETLEGWLYQKRKKTIKANEDFENILNILGEHKDFILYLRDFESGLHEKATPIPGGGASGIAMPAIWPRSDFGKSSTAKCFSFFSAGYPVIMLNNTSEKTVLPDESLLIYPPDELWFETFQYLAICAKYVVIDFYTPNLADFETSNISKGFCMELETLIALNEKKLIFTGSMKSYESLIQFAPPLHSLIFFRIEDYAAQEFTAFKQAEIFYHGK